MFAPKNAFIFAPLINEPPNTSNPSGNDATGAFIPGAAKFEKFCTDNGGQATKLLFNNHAPERQVFDQILHALRGAPAQLDTVVYFGHGIKDLMVSAKIGPGFLAEFVRALWAACGFGPRIVLYACSCGAKDGIASKIADGLSDKLAIVYGHSVPGHAYMNAMAYWYPSGLQAWPWGSYTAWFAKINDPTNDLWMRFPFLTEDELRAEVGA
jgi:hypothetical protein